MALQRVIPNLLTWYELNHRPLPWRETKNPYHIWISEIILQQTRVEQGKSYYHKFIDEFPEILDLAQAEEQAVLKVWQGLGYYSRARNLQKAAQIIAREMDGVFPQQYELIRSLPGIGEYTAAAIVSFAFGQPFAAIDGNVKRWSSRFFGVDIPISKPSFSKVVGPLLQEAIAQTLRPDLFNQASIELGSQVCTASNPKCDNCPLQESCYAFANHQQNQLPVVIKKSQPREWNLHFLAVHHQDKVCVVRRPKSGIWAGLYEFPSLTVGSQEKGFPAQWERALGDNIEILHVQKQGHLLSHKRIEASCWSVRWKLEVKPNFGTAESSLFDAANGQDENSELWISLSEIERYPVHRLMQHFLTNNQHD
ncbi:MAG: A/G-specific adenine glycosylase [Bacteroidota bacterium]